MQSSERPNTRVGGFVRGVAAQNTKDSILGVLDNTRYTRN